MKRFLCALALVLAAAAPALATPFSDVAGAMTAFAKANSYHMSVTARSHSGEVDMVKPGRLHAVFGPMEMIKIDQTTYVKMGGTWRQFSFPGMDQFNNLYQGVLDRASHPRDDMMVVDLGMKTVEGQPLHAYTFKNKDEALPTTLYIDAKGLPARIEGSDGLGIRITNINGPIAIDAPM